MNGVARHKELKNSEQLHYFLTCTGDSEFKSKKSVVPFGFFGPAVSLAEHRQKTLENVHFRSFYAKNI
jgi:hypothetical protein